MCFMYIIIKNSVFLNIFILFQEEKIYIYIWNIMIINCMSINKSDFIYKIYVI